MFFFRKIPKSMFNSITNPILRSESKRTVAWWSASQPQKHLNSHYSNSSILYVSSLVMHQARRQDEGASMSFASMLVMALVGGIQLVTPDKKPPASKPVIYKKPENTTTIRIWFPNRIFNQELGHIAIETQNSYLSFRPGYTSKDVQNQSYQNDVEIMGRECDRVYQFYTLDVQEIAKRSRNFAKSDFENTGIFDHEKQKILTEQIVGIPYNQWRTNLSDFIPKEYHEWVFDKVSLGLKPDETSQKKVALMNWYNLLFVHFILSVPHKHKTTKRLEKTYIEADNVEPPLVIDMLSNPILVALTVWGFSIGGPLLWGGSVAVGKLIRNTYTYSASNKFSLDEARFDEVMRKLGDSEVNLCDLVDPDNSNQPKPC